MFGKDQKRPDLEMFTIFDTKTATYRIPSYAINKYDLLRQIENMFKDPSQEKNDLNTNAEDFQVFKIGEYDRLTGQLAAQKPEHVANLHEIKASLKARALEST